MDKNMKILIVDDFSTMRRIIKNLLRDLGLNNTHEADDGNTALPMLKNGDFDFVVTDINMPNMNGFQLLSAIKKDPALAAIEQRNRAAAPMPAAVRERLNQLKKGA